MEQIERIKSMEERLNRVSLVLTRLSSVLDEFEHVQADIRALETYYASDEWKQDFIDDAAGRLPKDLKRGVLSEDGIWNLLEQDQDLKARMMTC